ncbi:site-2 protease family protein [Paenisporosarcina sp. TG20]|uniref:site-2 protease family protein n=1 Tax=Paenisporosarcina sp. TG20 TaxID=1211706 RepID=UPI0002D399BD|nr:site-2 protease family protein [Paenisporosarcina sp. TG20]
MYLNKIRLHPILLPIIIYLIVTSQFAYYSIIFSSLLIHELGHIVAAKWTGLKLESCTILPYGGEIKIKRLHHAPAHHQWLIAIAGPLSTAILYLVAQLFEFPGQDFFNTVQLTILALNLLPILPLDGGQALKAIIGKRHQDTYLALSICVSTLLILVSHDQLHLSFIFAFITFQNIRTWQYRKYEEVFNKVLTKQLTLP